MESEETRPPSYKFAKIATRGKFLDFNDSRAPFLATEILPNGNDLKTKFQVGFTVAPDNSPTTYFRHYIDQHQLLLLAEMMLNRTTGDPGRDGYLPGFPEFKGSQDSHYPNWPLTSRIFGVKYTEQLTRQGPTYIFEFAAGKGKGSLQGIVTPDGPAEHRGSIALPIYGTKDMPPLAMYLALDIKHYLQAREVSRQVIMAQTIAQLRYAVAGGDLNAKQRLETMNEELFGKKKDKPVTQGQTQPNNYSPNNYAPKGGAYAEDNPF